ncbi:hypothetical protein RUM43_006066 [Polyplax serrata]|uniref:Uncharacterized protein n=1 Tax=Polyplax serrata TaxID=468196 RepID=A0AAN8S583_POLSC
MLFFHTFMTSVTLKGRTRIGRCLGMFSDVVIQEPSALHLFILDLVLCRFESGRGYGGFQKVKSIELKFDYRCEVAKLPLRVAQSVIEQLSGHPARVLEREIQAVKAGEVMTPSSCWSTSSPKEPAALVETAVIKLTANVLKEPLNSPGLHCSCP